MMGQAFGAVLSGIDAVVVQVEVHAGGGLPETQAVGLPGATVREGLRRIRAAFAQQSLPYPSGRVLINLAPAELPKPGTGLDLAMAAALLSAQGLVPQGFTRAAVVAGELGLDGAVRPVRGVLSTAMAAEASGRARVVVPAGNADEAALVEGLQVLAVAGLADLLAAARDQLEPHPRPDVARLLAARQAQAIPDLADVRGQPLGRRALEVAAAGGHHLLLAGPPGSGKSLLAHRMAGILPPPTFAEALEVTRVWSAAGLARSLVARRPFRAPHHSISLVGMTGGSADLRPGEISLAHRGVLYLDEMPEFRRETLEALRQPLEDGEIRVVRARGSAVFPADLMLLASMNPCPCGWAGDPRGRCRCTEREVRRYVRRLSGPLLDRFDLVAELPPVDLRAMAGSTPGEDSAAVRRRVEAARQAQRDRFGPAGPGCNARMRGPDLERYVRLDAEGQRLLLAAAESLGLTARGFERVRRVARTLADLDGEAGVRAPHLAEAVQFRPRSPLGGRG